ncbi:MAG TPA: Flp pilus assembly protein CpaB [Rhizomicrobium sp.]|nr:Flp pilus assembly protein CpaB [Rhizomicrobium sp.]
MRTVLLASANRHRTVLLASGAVLTALLVLMTSPHGTRGRNGRQGSISSASESAETALPGNVTRGGRPAAFDQTLKEGARLRASLISPNESASASDGIAAHLSVGQRAFAMRVTEDDIVGGFLQSGDRVDILAIIPGSAFPQKDTLNAPDRSNALLLLQDIPVLAVGANLGNTGTSQADAHTVSLSLTPDQLVRLTLALRLGKVSLAIRRPGDDGVSTVVGATLSDILPALRPVEPAPQPHRTTGTSPVTGHQIPFYAGAHAATMTLGGKP